MTGEMSTINGLVVLSRQAKTSIVKGSWFYEVSKKTRTSNSGNMTCSPLCLQDLRLFSSETRTSKADQSDPCSPKQLLLSFSFSFSTFSSSFASPFSLWRQGHGVAPPIREPSFGSPIRSGVKLGQNAHPKGEGV